MINDDIIEVEEFFERIGNMHLPAFWRIKTALEEAQKQSTSSTNNERVQSLCDVGGCREEALHCYCDHHFDKVREMWIAERY